MMIRLKEGFYLRDEKKPLEGIVVLEAAMLLAGPFTAALLAEFGAEVIKVEKPGMGDPLRNMVTMDDGEPLWFASMGRNKKSVGLDLNTIEGQELFKDLCREADLVIEAFRPGTFEEKWGLDYKVLSSLNPGIILMHISGFGQTGPYGKRAGFGRTCQAFAGLTYLTGFPDRPPITTPYPLGDYSAGFLGAYAAMLALYHRDQNNGQGQEIDLSIYEAIFRQLEFLAPEYHQKGIVRERKEPWSANTGPTGVWRSKDDKWVAITVTTDKVYKRMCKAIEKPELVEDQRFINQKVRKVHEKELSSILGQWVLKYGGEEAAEILNKYDVPTSLCMSVEDIFKDPHYAIRDMIPEIPHPTLGTLKVPGVVPKLSRTPGEINSLGPRLGQDTREVLERFHIGEDRIEELAKKGIILCE